MIVKWINRFGHTCFVTVLLLIRRTKSNNWGSLIVEVKPKKTLKLVVIVRNSLLAITQVKY